MEETGDRTIILLGPTASGKTATAVALAERIGGEIVSADAFQVYRGMAIATAKPAPAILSRVPHHLIDILPTDEAYTVARFRALALAAMKEIRGRRRTPLVVGGAAMYITALVDGLCAAPAADPFLRSALAEEEKSKGPGSLHNQLSEVDPVSAERIHPRNVKRIIRALEVFRLTGTPISRLQRQWGRGGRDNRNGRNGRNGRDGRNGGDNRGKDESRETEYLMVGLRRARADLERRIEKRVEEMFAAGLIEETRRLMGAGAAGSLTAWKALGYREVEGHLRGDYPLDEAKRRIVVNTRRFARRQMIWWKRDRRIVWISVTAEEKPEETAVGIIEKLQITINK